MTHEYYTVELKVLSFYSKEEAKKYEKDLISLLCSRPENKELAFISITKKEIYEWDQKDEN